MRIVLKPNQKSRYLDDKVEYTVHAVYSSKLIEFMVMSEAHSFPIAVKSSEVDIIDNRLSKYWVYGNHDSDNTEPCKLVLSFPEWANNSYFYQELVEGTGKSGEQFRAIKKTIENEYAERGLTAIAETLQDRWVQCPNCFDSWENFQIAEVINCPKCKSRLLKPIDKV